MGESKHQLAERVRSGCVQAALDAYEDAGLSGLCAEGRWEYAIDVLRHLDLDPLLGAELPDFSGPEHDRPEHG
jgi:hypothetical protein